MKMHQNILGGKGRDLRSMSKEGKGSVTASMAISTGEKKNSENSALTILMSERKAHRKTAQGKPYEGKPHVRFDEGTVET